MENMRFTVLIPACNKQPEPDFGIRCISCNLHDELVSGESNRYRVVEIPCPTAAKVIIGRA